MPSKNLKAAMMPLDIETGNIEANIRQLENRLNNLDADTDMVVLPEMFSTGFITDESMLKQLAEPNNGHTINTISHLATKHGIGICGGFIATDNDGQTYYNRGFFADDNGDIAFYDKRHLFSCGEESRLFTAGTRQSPNIHFRSWNIKMAICYDIRFPIWNRSIANDYDALIVPANWPHIRFYAWKHMLIARAIENQIYTLGCNREGCDVYGSYNRGDSLVFNNWGQNVSDLRNDGTVYALMDAEKFNADRSRFAPWRDADQFSIII